MEQPVTVNRGPLFASSVISVLAGAIAVVTSGLISLLALFFGVLGLGLVAVGVFVLDSRSAVSFGAGSILVCVLIGGVSGIPAHLLLLSMVGTITAWDVGHYGIALGTQLGKGDHNRRVEYVHAGITLALGIVAASVAYMVYTLSPGGQPVSALIFLLLATMFLGWAVRA